MNHPRAGRRSTRRAVDRHRRPSINTTTATTRNPTTPTKAVVTTTPLTPPQQQLTTTTTRTITLRRPYRRPANTATRRRPTCRPPNTATTTAESTAAATTAVTMKPTITVRQRTRSQAAATRQDRLTRARCRPKAPTTHRAAAQQPTANRLHPSPGADCRGHGAALEPVPIHAPVTNDQNRRRTRRGAIPRDQDPTRALQTAITARDRTADRRLRVPVRSLARTQMTAEATDTTTPVTDIRRPLANRRGNVLATTTLTHGADPRRHRTRTTATGAAARHHETADRRTTSTNRTSTLSLR